MEDFLLFKSGESFMLVNLLCYDKRASKRARSVIMIIVLVPRKDKIELRLAKMLSNEPLRDFLINQKPSLG